MCHTCTAYTQIKSFPTRNIVLAYTKVYVNYLKITGFCLFSRNVDLDLLNMAFNFYQQYKQIETLFTNGSKFNSAKNRLHILIQINASEWQTKQDLSLSLLRYLTLPALARCMEM